MNTETGFERALKKRGSKRNVSEHRGVHGQVEGALLLLFFVRSGAKTMWTYAPMKVLHYGSQGQPDASPLNPPQSVGLLRDSGFPSIVFAFQLGSQLA